MTIAAGDTPRPLSPAEQHRVRERLLEAPALEEADAKLAGTATQIRDLVTELVPGYQWQLDHQNKSTGTTPCHDEFKGSGAVRLASAWWVGPEIPLEVRGQVFERAYQVARAAGLTSADFKDAGSDITTLLNQYVTESKSLRTINQDGATLGLFDYQEIPEMPTILRYAVPCLMPQAVKDLWLSDQTPDRDVRYDNLPPVAPLPIYSPTTTPSATRSSN